MKTFIVCILVIVVCGIIGSTFDMNPDNSEVKKNQFSVDSLLNVLSTEKNKIISRPKLHEYQMEVYNDSNVIFDGDRRVGVIQYDKFSAIDSIIDFDNL